MGNASLDNGGLHAAVEDTFPGPAVVGFEMTAGRKTPLLYVANRAQAALCLAVAAVLNP